jgi:glycosyltransferase involved in cell wall biosynthesis
MKHRNLLRLAWEYYKLYGFSFFFIRLRNTLANALFGRLAPLSGQAWRLPRRIASVQRSELPDIFFLSGNEWELRIQRPQHIAAALARQGSTVHYCSPSSCPSPGPGWRLTKKAERLWQVRFFSKKMYRLKDIDSPKNYAGFANSFLDYLNAAAKGRKVVVLAQQPVWALHLRGLDESIPVFYDCIDEHSDFPNAPALAKSLEEELIRRSRGIIYTSDRLFKASAACPEKPMIILRNACEYEHFAKTRPGDASRPGGRKVIGYHGALGEWFDADLVAKLALAFPRHTVRLVGACVPAVRKRLAGIGNIELVGEVNYKRLPAYVHSFDIGLLPFRIQPLTLGTNPVKIYEYLAAGLPVMAVPLPEMEQFGDLVRTGLGQAFIEAVGEELTLAPPLEAFAARQAFARKETWDIRAKTLAAFLQTMADYSPAP